MINMAEFLKEGPLRKYLRERETLIPRKKLVDFFGSSSPIVFVAGREIDEEIERLREEKRIEWRRRGYREPLIRMAIELADEWASSMAEAFAPRELQEAVARHIYPKALNVANRWIRAMAV